MGKNVEGYTTELKVVVSREGMAGWACGLRGRYFHFSTHTAILIEFFTSLHHFILSIFQGKKIPSRDACSNSKPRSYYFRLKINPITKHHQSPTEVDLRKALALSC